MAAYFKRRLLSLRLGRIGEREDLVCQLELALEGLGGKVGPRDLHLALVGTQSLWGTPLITDALTPLVLLVACSSKSSEQGARCPSCRQ